MQFTTEQNKQLVIRFNKEYVEKGDRKSFEELVAEDVVNHAAPPGTSQGPDSMIHFLQNILRTGFPDLSVEILDRLLKATSFQPGRPFTQHIPAISWVFRLPEKRSSSTLLTLFA